LGPVVQFLHHLVAVHRPLVEQRQYGDANVAATTAAPSSGRELTLATFFAASSAMGTVATTIAGATLKGVAVATFRVPASPRWRVFRMLSVCHKRILSIGL
jgi:hypothetical protein